MSATRVFNGVDGAPRIVAVIPLTFDVSAKKVVNSLAEVLDLPSADCPEDGVWKMRCGSHFIRSEISKLTDTEPIASKLRCNSAQCHTEIFTRLWMHARSLIMWSLFCPAVFKLTNGVTPCCAPCRLKACPKLSAWYHRTRN